MSRELSKLCLHSITTKPWPLDVALDRYEAAGVAGISVWREAAHQMGMDRSRRCHDGALRWAIVVN